MFSVLKVAALGTCLFVLPAFASDEVEIDIPAKIDVQGKKVLWSNTEDTAVNNLEEWYGRATVSVTAKSKDFEGKITVRAYPADFGSENFVQKISFDTTLVPNAIITGPNSYHDSLITKTHIDTTYTDRFELYEAWSSYKGSVLDMKFGRYFSNDRVGMAFGNYADEKPGDKFMPAGVAMNAIEISHTWYGNVFFRAALESKARNLNRGDLRIAVKLSKLSSLEWLNVGLNYRNNMFDVIKYTDSTVQHSAAATVEIPMGKWRVWTELGIREFSSNGDTPTMPITGGIEVPGGRAFDKVLFEAEWLHNRKAEGTYSSKEVLGSAFVQKKIGDHFMISFGVQNNGATEDFAMVGRLTGTIN